MSIMPRHTHLCCLNKFGYALLHCRLKCHQRHFFQYKNASIFFVLVFHLNFYAISVHILLQFTIVYCILHNIFFAFFLPKKFSCLRGLRFRFWDRCHFSFHRNRFRRESWREKKRKNMDKKTQVTFILNEFTALLNIV